MVNYKHHLFFEVRDLTDKERNKIRQHFVKKRDSGGGECGMIEKIGANAYKISFKEKEDQERVLQRKFHTISLPSGELRLTVSRTNQSQGPENVVQSGAPKHDESKKKVMEKRVYLPTDLITFITSSGAISKYEACFQQSFRNPVSLDLGSELVLSSVSSDDLDEAMAVVLRDLSVANVELRGAAAVPPDLDRVKEIMIKAKNEANCRGLRVDVSFIPGPSGTIKVRLVGYSENVNKLKEVLHEYQMSQVGIQEMLKLPFPELVDCFDKFLNMTDVKQNRVTLKPSHVPYPCVRVSGPRCLVKEVQAELSKALSSLSSDRLVLDGPGARQYFQAEGKVSKELVESSCHVLIREQQVSVPRLPQVQQQQQLPLSFVGTLHTTSTSQQSIFLFLGLSRKDVDDAMTKLKELYQAQCSTQTFKKEELAGLTPDNMKDLKQLVESQGLYMRMCGQDSLTVSGLKDGVNKVMQMMIASLQGSLKRERKVRAELKHIVTISDFTFPTYWDNMGNDENLKVVVLQPSSSEYRTVKEAFTRTVSKTVMKIERLQNVYLRRAYEVQKKNLSDKNKQKGGAGEKLLYHGTNKDNCDSIMKTGFNRSFAGQNATVFGQGTYFAVKASYSANPTYSRPAADGTQLMFVARVLTGIYTLGQGYMKVPPLRTDLQSNDRYDSVVDNMNNPNMYVVFHDNQAYPDYLITFK